MKNNFEQDVSETLTILHSVLDRKVKKMQPRHYACCMRYVVNLKRALSDLDEYCLSNDKFEKYMKSLGFDVATEYSLFSVDRNAAQHVYDVMTCMHDYMCFTDESRKSDAYKYKSQQDAIGAMNLFKRDSIQMNGGMLLYSARNLWKSVFNRTK